MLKFLCRTTLLTVIIGTPAFVSNPAVRAEPMYFPSADNQIQVDMYDQKDGRLRAKVQVTARPYNQASGRKLIQMTHDGSGDFDVYSDVTWQTTSIVEITAQDLRILSSHKVVRRGETILVEYSKTYDYEKKTIDWKKHKGADLILKKAEFPIKGMTCDDTNLPFFLKMYLYHQDDPGHQLFYLLTDEPRLYKTKIQTVGHENLRTAEGEKPAVQLKITGDVGVIDDLLEKFVPPTFLWYETEPPYKWLKYQGFECGYRSPYIVSYAFEQD